MSADPKAQPETYRALRESLADRTYAQVATSAASYKTSVLKLTTEAI